MLGAGTLAVLDSERVGLVASLAARVKRVQDWADETDILDRQGRHRIRAHPVIDSLDKWEHRLTGTFRLLDRRRPHGWLTEQPNRHHSSSASCDGDVQAAASSCTRHG